MKKTTYSSQQFESDKNFILASIPPEHIEYVGEDSRTYRISFEDATLRIHVECVLSKGTVIIRNGKGRRIVRYKQTIPQIINTLEYYYNFL
jgi:hypothetical protein